MCETTQVWTAELTCGGTTLVHMVYSRSRKDFCHCSLAGPTVSITLSRAASLVKKSTASLSVSATATSKTPKRHFIRTAQNCHYSLGWRARCDSDATQRCQKGTQSGLLARSRGSTAGGCNAKNTTHNKAYQRHILFTPLLGTLKHMMQNEVGSKADSPV